MKEVISIRGRYGNTVLCDVGLLYMPLVAVYEII